MELSNRNVKIDVARGIAILMVVLGHTIQYFQGGTQTLLSNIIFSLQMPLFMLISGYVCKYSKPIDNFNAFFKRLFKKSYALLLPWLVWTILRFFITFNSYFGNDGFLEYIKYIITHMDSGYWFLFSLFSIDLIVSVSELLSCLIKFTAQSKIATKIIQMIFVGVLFGGLGVLGKFVGMQFLSIKYTLYYIPFFCIGYLFGEFNDEINSIKHYKPIVGVSVSIFAITYVIMILQFNIQSMSDSALNVLVRMIISLTGCAVLFYIVERTNCTGKLPDFLCHCGKHSLEIYLVHYCFLKFINTAEIALTSISGILVCVINYALCLACTFGVIYVVSKISYLNRALFAKK